MQSITFAFLLLACTYPSYFTAAVGGFAILDRRNTSPGRVGGPQQQQLQRRFDASMLTTPGVASPQNQHLERRGTDAVSIDEHYRPALTRRGVASFGGHPAQSHLVRRSPQDDEWDDEEEWGDDEEEWSDDDWEEDDESEDDSEWDESSDDEEWEEDSTSGFSNSSDSTTIDEFGDKGVLSTGGWGPPLVPSTKTVTPSGNTLSSAKASSDQPLASDDTNGSPPTVAGDYTVPVASEPLAPATSEVGPVTTSSTTVLTRAANTTNSTISMAIVPGSSIPVTDGTMATSAGPTTGGTTPVVSDALAVAGTNPEFDVIPVVVLNKTNSNVSNATASNVTASNATTSNATASNATTSNVTASNVTASNVTASHVTASHVTASIVTASNITASNTTANNATTNTTASNATASNATVSNVTSNADNSTATDDTSDLLSSLFGGDSAKATASPINLNSTSPTSSNNSASTSGAGIAAAAYNGSR